jgi:hypothetical protein
MDLYWQILAGAAGRAFFPAKVFPKQTFYSENNRCYIDVSQVLHYGLHTVLSAIPLTPAN